MKGRIQTALLGTLVAAALPARAEQFDFTRVVPSSSLTAWSLGATYGAEGQRSLQVTEKNAGSSGPAPGSESERQYRGMSHRVASFVGVVDAFGLGGELVFQTLDGLTALRLIVPELRVHGLFVGPIELGTYAAVRIRRNSRREPSGTVGATVEHWGRRARFASHVGFEYGPLDEPEPSYGGRYAVAAGYGVLPWLLVGGEGWGQMSTLAGRFEQGHHFGPTARFSISEPAWVAVNVSIGVNDRPQRTYTDCSALVQLGGTLD